MSIREGLRYGSLRAKWRIVDALIAAKQRAPVDFDGGSDRFGYALLIPGVLLVSFLAVGMVFLAWYSVLTYDTVEIIAYEYTLANWRDLIDTGTFYTVFVRTIMYSAAVTAGCVALAIPYAYLVVRTDRTLFRYLLLFGLFVPFFTGVIIRAYGWLIILGENGLLNWVLGTLSLPTVSFLGTPVAVLLGLLQYLLPFAVLMLTPAIASIDPDLERAAKNCGANQWQTFRHVVLPLARPGITAATIVSFTICMANYSIPDLLGGGTLSFVANFIYNQVFGTLNYPFAAVLSVVLVAVASSFVLVVFKMYGTGTLGVEVDEA
ncbi:ABC transporter permease [Halobellus salinus]|uniref:ABC transporter permease n=1 Tax=Halobellus salinus TaxID=931585 RepID=A0A830EES8_9EURY|nr:ABC transporter permease [Halobellus salinus]GGJ17400.1 ABC transporter permease [Halobellus salinus]SMP27583.1 putative spermidine/putrescine transport system permease protein [Halobellus salinus]